MRFLADKLPFRIVVITGACRSGKTCLGNFLAKEDFVEYEDEPLFLMMLPVMAGLGMINKKVAEDIFLACSTEFLIDRVLMRNANFRPQDLSTVWTKKCAKDIFERLDLKGREEARNYIYSKSLVLLYTFAEVTPFVDFIPAPVIHVVRDRESVAKDIVKKGWFSEEKLLCPTNAMICREIEYKKKKWYLPWWVKDEKFIEMTEYEKGLYYWQVLADRSDPMLDKCFVIRFEKMIKNPQQTVQSVWRYLNGCKKIL